MRDSASQGSLMKAVGARQGPITEEGYKVQAENYRNMGQAARMASEAEDRAADRAPWMAAIHGAAAVASFFGPVPSAAPTGGAAESAIGDPTGIGGLY
jgi:predicted phage tail protein